MRAALVCACVAFAACGVEESTEAEAASQTAELRLPPPPTQAWCPDWSRSLDVSAANGTTFSGVGCVYQQLIGASAGTITEISVQFPVFVASQCASNFATAAFAGEGFPTPVINEVSTFKNGVCEVHVCGHVSPSAYPQQVLVNASDPLARVNVTQWGLSSNPVTYVLQVNHHRAHCSITDVR